MTAILTGIAGVFAREIIQYLGALFQKFVQKNAEIAASDAKIDQHAKDVTQEMENSHDPKQMDQADSDILSGK